MKNEDDQFLNLLKILDTNVPIKWSDFEQIIQKIKSKKVNIQLDTDASDTYDRKFADLQKKENSQLQAMKQINIRRKSIQSSYEKQIQNIATSERSEQSRLGTKPSPRPTYRTKGFWIFKSEEFAGYDYSEQERWNEKMANIKSKYQRKKREEEQAFRNSQRSIDAEHRNMQQELDKLKDQEDYLRNSMFQQIFLAIDQNIEKLKQLHSKQLKNMKDEWQQLKAEQEQHCYDHIREIESAFSKFIEISKNEQLKQLQVL